MNKIRFTVLVCIILSVLYYPCKKDNTNPPKTSKKEILIKKSWQVDEVMSSVSCENRHYIRGGINNTGVNY